MATVIISKSVREKEKEEENICHKRSKMRKILAKKMRNQTLAQSHPQRTGLHTLHTRCSKTAKKTKTQIKRNSIE